MEQKFVFVVKRNAIWGSGFHNGDVVERACCISPEFSSEESLSKVSQVWRDLVWQETNSQSCRGSAWQSVTSKYPGTCHIKGMPESSPRPSCASVSSLQRSRALPEYEQLRMLPPKGDGRCLAATSKTDTKLKGGRAERTALGCWGSRVSGPCRCVRSIRQCCL